MFFLNFLTNYIYVCINKQPYYEMYIHEWKTNYSFFSCQYFNFYLLLLSLQMRAEVKNLHVY